MVFARLQETDTCTAYAGDVRSLKLSFAVWVIDDYTKQKPLGKIQVETKETGKKASQNLSGYYFFTDLNAGNYKLTIKPELYFPEEITVDMSAFSDPKKPVVEINGKPEIALKPNPRYPFPANATLLRGQIESSSGKTVTGLRVGVDGRDIENLADSKGEFVLYFKNIAKTEEVTLTINGEAVESSFTVQEGKTVSSKKILIQ